MRIGASGRIGWIVGLAGMVLAAEPACAQLASVTSTIAGSECGAADADGDCRQSVAFSEPNDGQAFTSRYAFNVNADTFVGSTRDEGGSARHTVSFTATAPGSYRLTIESAYVGGVTRLSDFEGCNGSAVVGFPSGASNVPLSSGSLGGGTDPFVVPNGGGDGNKNFRVVDGATIDRLSNGVAQKHVLTFTFSASVRSNSCEMAVRFGAQNVTTTSCDACGYAGTPARSQKDDGHFVRVSLLSFCGNGVVDAAGEECDEGGDNGVPTSCCSAGCLLVQAGKECRASAGDCDPPEACSGKGGACPPDAFLPIGVCRPAAGLCDLAESCTGSDAACPPDAFQPATVVCRGSEGICDVAETCTGGSADCPPDALASGATICRAATGPCDVAERCDGTSVTCPADALAPSTTVCRAAAGACDVAERCTGVDTTCPPDGTVPEDSACSDGNQCTVGDRCHGGTCTAGPPVACEGDGICDPTSGRCGPRAFCPATCDDANPCTTDACDTTLGQCTHEPIADGPPCERTDACTSGPKTCQSGDCGVRQCDVGAEQVVENDVPQPAVDVSCEVLVTRRNGRPKNGSCSATVFDATGSAGALATPAADAVRRSPKKAKAAALSGRVKTPLRGERAHFTLELTEHGKQLLAQSPGGQLTVEVRGRIAFGAARKGFTKTVTLRR